MKISVILLSSLVTVSMVPAAPGVTFEVLQPSGALSTMGTPGNVSSDGSVIVGEAWSVDTWINEAFRWTAGTGMEKLNLSLTAPSTSKAWGTSDDGTVVAGWAIYADERTFCWTDSGMQTVSSKKGSGVFDLAADGSMAVGKTPVTGRSSGVQAVQWTPSGSTAWSQQNLGDLSGGANRSLARRISGDKSTIVGWGTNASGTVACQWSAGSPNSAEALGDLPGGRYFSEACDVSDDGSVIVGRGTTAEGIEAFRWTTSGIAPLGELPGGVHFSEARSVSGDGAIIVGVSNSAIGREVFVWDAAAGMRGLVGLLETAGIDVNGWSFTYAEPLLSADGDTLVGSAISPAQDAVMWRVTGLRSILGEIPKPVVTLGPGPGGFAVTFTTRSGFQYQVQSCPSLDDPGAWQDVGTSLVGDGLDHTIECPDTGIPCAFFRLAVSAVGASPE